MKERISNVSVAVENTMIKSNLWKSFLWFPAPEGDSTNTRGNMAAGAWSRKLREHIFNRNLEPGTRYLNMSAYCLCVSVPQQGVSDVCHNGYCDLSYVDAGGQDSGPRAHVNKPRGV